MEIVESSLSSSSSSCVVPPGFRFHPTEEELVGYYLNRKINSLKIDLDVIIDIDLYRIEPWDIQESCKLGYDEGQQKEWYFFSHKDRKYPTGTRTNRATAAGFWKATGRDKAVLSKDNKLIGMRKTLVYYKGRAPNGRKSDWIMHEYRLHTSEHQPPQEEGWVVCRAFKKPSPIGQQKQQGWNNMMNSRYYYVRSDYYDIINSTPFSSCVSTATNHDNLNMILINQQQQQQPLLSSNIIYDQDQMVDLIPNVHDHSPSLSGFASTNDDAIVGQDRIHDDDDHHQRDFLVSNGDHSYDQWKNSFDHKQLIDESDQVIAAGSYSTYAQHPITPLLGSITHTNSNSFEPYMY